MCVCVCVCVCARAIFLQMHQIHYNHCNDYQGGNTKYENVS